MSHESATIKHKKGLSDISGWHPIQLPRAKWFFKRHIRRIMRRIGKRLVQEE